MEEAMEKHGGAKAARCGVIRTRAVSRVCTIMLLRRVVPSRATWPADAACRGGRRHGGHSRLERGKGRLAVERRGPAAACRGAARRQHSDGRETRADRRRTRSLADARARGSPPDRGTAPRSSRRATSASARLLRWAFVDSPSPRNSRPTCSGSSCCNRWSDHVALSVGSN